MMFSSTVCRFSGRECWNTMPKPLRAILCAGRPATFSPWNTTSPAVGRSMPMIAFIAVDLPDPFGPIRPKISPARRSRAEVLDGGEAAEALGQAADLEHRRVARGCIHHERASARQGRSEEAAGEEQDDQQRHRRDDEGRELAGRPQEFAGHDQEDRAERRAEHRAPAAEHGGDDDVARRPRRRRRCRPTRCRNRTPAARRTGRRRTR